MKNDDAQFKKMTEESIPRLIASLSVPTVISMLVTSVYNMADTYFVSRLGTSASGAVGVVFSLMAIIQAVGFAIGMGSGSLISRLLGQQKEDEATEIASSAIFMGIGLGIILAAIASIKINDLMLIFGATETILPYAVSYARYIIFGAPVMMGSFIMNNILRSQGRAKYAMIGIGFGGVLNVVLDPLFIFTFNMGTAGAAIATLVSQCVSFLILLACFLTGKSAAKLKITKMSRSPKKYLMILKTGLPSLSRQGLSSVATMLLNRNARIYGDAAVAAMSIVGKIFMIIFAVLIGIGQGFQPVAGFNYGAKRFDRVKKAFVFTLLMGGAVMIIMGTPVYFCADWLMERFTKGDADVVKIGKTALRLQCLALPLIPISTVCNMTYQTTGKSWTATLLSGARQGLFFIPLIMILPAKFGIFGLQLSQPLADLLASLFCVPFGIKFLHELKRK
ncbi:MAG: MATE family efflux transporter [Clostridia bacterium]|nr:MATE family efflux transporter [Clostridia bacterium]